jgi:hypothetical protein
MDEPHAVATEKNLSSTTMEACGKHHAGSQMVDDKGHQAGGNSAYGSAKHSGSDSSSHIPTFLRKALRAGRVEENGIRPLALEDRTETRFFNIFTVWFSINSNILGFVASPRPLSPQN